MSLLDDLRDTLPGATFYGNYISCRCVFHNDKSPSMLVNEKTYKCLSCGKFGRTKELVQFLSGKPAPSRSGAYKPRLWWSLNLKESEYEDVAIEAHHNLLRHPEYGYYLRDRKVDSMIGKMFLGFMDGYYIFPILDNDFDFVGLIARAGPVIQETTGTRYIVPPGQPPMLYTDWQMITKADKIFAPYGIMDALSLLACGIPAVSGSLGHNLPGELFRNIRKKIFILEDSDGKDHKSATKLMTELGWRGKIVRPDYGPAKKDCNDVLRVSGKDAVISLIDQIQTVDSLYQWNLCVGVSQ